MSKLTSLCVCTYENTKHLTQVFQSIARHAVEPYEVVVVDDASKNQDVVKTLEMFSRLFKNKGIRFDYYVNSENMKHAASQNRAWKLAEGEVLFHIEDDIIVPYDGWNQKFAKFLQDHPEVGQVIPHGSGRGEWIPRGPYNEFMWGLGGLFAVTREVFEKVGGWDEALVHQVEPDYNLQVRMGGYRLGEIPGIKMVHLGEGEQHDTFRRQAQILCGVHTMLMKWNKRFVGVWDYDSLWSMSWDDFPPNMAFRRKLAAWFAAEKQKLEDRYRGLGTLKDDPKYRDSVPDDVRKAHEKLSTCEMNMSPPKFKYPGHWGQFELVQTIRAGGRQREQELITLMKNNHVFRDVHRLEQQLRDLAKRMNYNLEEEELRQLLKAQPVDYKWLPKPAYPK